MCGGTSTVMVTVSVTKGLSPRVRGNHPSRAHPRRPARSIPACAGEPPTFCCSFVILRVYPRVCGGTQGVAPFSRYCRGLSPRVRGNPAAGGAAEAYERVYPRVCGGTSTMPTAPVAVTGLSPRVRGNPPVARVYSGSQGSIPACAGEPVVDDLVFAHGGVYPRVCGGTRS